jgi:hypothetical protein
MHITKELHDQLIKCGFVFGELKQNQAEGHMLIVKYFFEDEYWNLRIPNNNRINLHDAIDRLIEQIYVLGLERGVKEGKKEVGEYLKNLTQD